MARTRGGTRFREAETESENEEIPHAEESENEENEEEEEENEEEEEDEGEDEGNESDYEELEPDQTVLAYTPSLESAREFMKRWINWTICGERGFSIELLRNIDFPYLDRMQRWGWLQLLENIDGVHKILVRIFYHNCVLGTSDREREREERRGPKSIKKKCEFSVWLNGAWVLINAGVINSFLNLNPPANSKDLPSTDSRFLLKACKRIFLNPQLIGWNLIRL